MNWKEFRDRIDSKLEELDIHPEDIEIEWIDVVFPIRSITVTVTAGTDDRLEMIIQ